MMSAFLAIVRRDLKLALRSGGGAGLGVVLLSLCCHDHPFARGAGPRAAGANRPAVLWIGALLASLIGLERLFSADVEDGSLDALSLSALPLELVTAAKGLAHWLATGLPLVLAAPVLALMLNVDPQAIGAVVLTLLWAPRPSTAPSGSSARPSPARSGAAGLADCVLVLPLAIPVLIFAAPRRARPSPGRCRSHAVPHSGGADPVRAGCLARWRRRRPLRTSR